MGALPQPEETTRAPGGRVGETPTIGVGVAPAAGAAALVAAVRSPDWAVGPQPQRKIRAAAAATKGARGIVFGYTTAARPVP